MPSTKENFWRMVDQENVSLIVMLTHTKEHGKVKCDQYWPSEICENETQQGFIFDYNKEVTLVSIETVMPNLIRRKFKIVDRSSPVNKSKNLTRIVTQLQYLTWPDHGAPEEQDFKILGTLLDNISDFHKESVQ